jgi:uncharacterized protein (DUF1330 family)
MPAYLVGTIRITDPASWQRYVERVGGTFAPFNGRLLFRGARPVGLSQTAHGDRIVVVEFPDMDSLRRWHDSPDYQALRPLREAAADVVLTGYEA